MTEPTPATLNHFAFFSFQEHYFEQPTSDRKAFHRDFLSGLREIAACTHLYQIYPAEGGIDFMVWSALEAQGNTTTSHFFSGFAQATNPYRQWLKPAHTLWGFTKPSQYSKARSTQEIDPFSPERQPYLVVYPFVKTGAWYMMSREARQGMMNEHIRIGKQYPQIKQLLLYSFGMQNQEFVVVYDTADLQLFSDLVYELRNTEARRYTERDTPLYTAIYHPAEDTLALWE